MIYLMTARSYLVLYIETKNPHYKTQALEQLSLARFELHKEDFINALSC